MQIVIDIPEEIYNDCKTQVEMMRQEGFLIESLNTALKIFVANGTPLPKGHGNLVDISELMNMLCLEDNAYNRDNNVAELITLEDIDRLDVIIEADKESIDG